MKSLVKLDKNGDQWVDVAVMKTEFDHLKVSVWEKVKAQNKRIDSLITTLRELGEKTIKLEKRVENLVEQLENNGAHIEVPVNNHRTMVSLYPVNFQEKKDKE